MRIAMSVTISLLVGGTSPTTVSDDVLRWQQQPNESIALIRGNTVLWQFNFNEAQTKPFFHPLAMPTGEVLTAKSPADHPWHYGLWLSWKTMNGVNYWEEDRKTGRPVGKTDWSDVRITTHDDHSAQIEMTLRYHQDDQPPTMTERRSIRVSTPATDGSFHIDWASRFTAKQDVELKGSYAGLSLRLANFEKRAAISSGGKVEFGDDQRARFQATATDYHGLIEGRPLGVAFCDHPANLNAPTPWYLIRSHVMSFLNPAVVSRQAHQMKSGETFAMRYRVIVHAGHWTTDRLCTEAMRFSRETEASSHPGGKIGFEHTQLRTDPSLCPEATARPPRHSPRPDHSSQFNGHHDEPNHR